MKKNGLQIITRRMVIFNTPCCIWQLVAQVGISGLTRWVITLQTKNEYGEAHSRFCSALNGSKEKKRYCPHHAGQVTINGTVAQFSCKQNIPKTLWDVKSKAKGKSREARDINLALDNIKAQIIKHYQRISDREAFVTAEMVRNAYQGIGSEYETLLKAFDRENEVFKKRVGKDRVMATYRARVRARNHVAAFIKSFYRRSDMSMLELTPDFIKEFAAYLSSWNPDCGTVRYGQTVCGWAWSWKRIITGWYRAILSSSFISAPMWKNGNIWRRMNWKRSWHIEFADSKLAYIRDIFIFASFTVLSFVDIQELTNDNIVEVNGEKWILSKRHKTKVAFQVKLLDIPLQIVERYRPMQKTIVYSPTWTIGLSANRWKRMIRECGITKSISFHCSRHGFATLALSKGMPIGKRKPCVGTYEYSHDPTLRKDNHAEARQRHDHVRRQTE